MSSSVADPGFDQGGPVTVCRGIIDGLKQALYSASGAHKVERSPSIYNSEIYSPFLNTILKF